MAKAKKDTNPDNVVAPTGPGKQARKPLDVELIVIRMIEALPADRRPDGWRAFRAKVLDG